MSRPPRKSSQPLIDKFMLIGIVIQVFRHAPGLELCLIVTRIDYSINCYVCYRLWVS